MIVFNCPACGKRFQTPDHAAGKAGTCPSCKAALTVPIAFEETAPSLREVVEPPPRLTVREPEAPRSSLFYPMLIGSGVAACALFGVVIGYSMSMGHAPAASPQPATAQESSVPASPKAISAPTAAPAPTIATTPAQAIAATIADDRARSMPSSQPAVHAAYPTPQAPNPNRLSTPWTPQASPAPAGGQGGISEVAQERNEIYQQIQDLRDRQNLKDLKRQRDNLEKQVDSPDQQDSAAPQTAFSAQNPPNSPADVVAVVAPSVVTVSTDEGTIGTGWIAFEKDLVVTNYHVIRGGQMFTIRATVGEDNDHRRKMQFECVVKAVSIAHDLALLEIKKPYMTVNGVMHQIDFRPLTISSAKVRAGDGVIAIGNPGMGDQILEQTVSTGIISNIERVVDDNTYIQTTAPINPGNSGGPLFNQYGEVIGVVTAKGVDVENIGFAVPVSAVKDLYLNRYSTYAVNNSDFTQWEHDHALETLINLAGAIKVNSFVNDMTIMHPGEDLIALATARNKVLVIDRANGRVTSEIFPGTEPTQMLPVGKNLLWVMCHSSNTFALVDIKAGKAVNQVHCVNPPVAFTITRDRIWYIDQQQVLFTMPLSGGSETQIDVRGVSSIAYVPGSREGDLLCGTSASWLLSVKSDTLLAIQSRIKRVDAEMASLRKQAFSGNQEAYRQYNELNQTDIELHSQLLDCVKPLSRPSDGNFKYGYNYSVQSLFLDSPHHRLYFNRIALELEHPENMLGQFADVDHSLNRNGYVNRFFQDYPYYRQILAVSPDGKYAASGTHLFNAADFTAVCEFPVPATSVVFAPDSRSLYLADPFNKQIDPFPIPGLEAKPGDAGGDKKPAQPGTPPAQDKPNAAAPAHPANAPPAPPTITAPPAPVPAINDP